MDYFLDTNIFLNTLIRQDDESFLHCKRILDFVKTNKINAFTSHSVISELAYALKSFYGIENKEIAKIIQGINNLSGLKIADGHNLIVAARFLSTTNTRYSNALIASIENINNQKWVVISYDKSFDELGVLRKEPGDILELYDELDQEYNY